MEVSAKFLEMLLAGASREDLDLVVAEAEVSGVSPEVLDGLRQQHALALRIQELMERQRSREAELTALYETARDLTAIRDLDAILAAIVRRARQLLGADMTYLSLNDEPEGASYMKVTDGALTPEFRELRLPLGTGLLGLVAQSGAPYFTEDYQADERFVHRDYIDTAVAGEEIRAILGVPLTVEGTVIGALLAVHRRVRPFPAGEVALLTSFAAHAAVALENARLFEQARTAVAEAAEANAELRSRNEATERAARAHDRLTDVLLHGGGVVEVADVLAEILGGQLSVYDEEGRLLAGPDHPPPDDAVEQARSSGRSVQSAEAWIAVAAAGDEHLGTLVLRTPESLDQPERRTLERGALVTALVLLFGRTEAEAESRVRGELLSDLVSGRDLDDVRLRERARQQGADLDGDLAIAVATPSAEQPGARVAATLARELHGLGGVHEGHVVVLAPGDPGQLGEQLRSPARRRHGRGDRCARRRDPAGVARGPSGAGRPAPARSPRRGERPRRPRSGPAAARRQRPRGARGVRPYDARTGARLRRGARDPSRRDAGGLVRRRRRAARDRGPAAHPPEHGHPAPRTGGAAARRELARPRPSARRAARAPDGAAAQECVTHGT